ncbi:hypothetical protein [Comamonas terrae]|uniref:Uncharacterized protein n=1 Tax=Comamonas terrae TaxID=673548 RepID=A0ABW5UK32_9BURK|nr:hypothetical protein [Comamonas terrae]
MHTETRQNSASQRHPLSPGQMLTLALTEGSTLTCLGAPIQLSATPLAALDACSGYSMCLRNGQSWRAPGRLWVQLVCVGERSSVQVQPGMPAASKNRLGLEGLRRWIARYRPGGRESATGIKRGQRAA